MSGRGRQLPAALVVVDYDDGRRMLRMMLEDRGFRVSEAADGEEAGCDAYILKPIDVGEFDSTLRRLLPGPALKGEDQQSLGAEGRRSTVHLARIVTGGKNG